MQQHLHIPLFEPSKLCRDPVLLLSLFTSIMGPCIATPKSAGHRIPETSSTAIHLTMQTEHRTERVRIG